MLIYMSKSTIKEYKCADCKVAMFYPFHRVRKRIENGISIRCKSCAQKRAARNRSPEAARAIQEGRKRAAKKIHNVPKSVRIERASKAGQGNRNNNGLAVRRQWETIKSDEKRYKQACERLKQTALNFHASMSEEEKKLHYAKVFKNTGKSKACELFLQAVETKTKRKILRKKMVSGFFVDGMFDEQEIILEFYGDMFHCNPIRFNDPNKYCSWISRTVGQQWKRDERRIVALLKNGYKVLIVWEYDWTNQSEEVVKRIKNALS